MLTPGTGLPEESFARTPSATGKNVEICVCCGVAPATGATETAVPAEFVSVKSAGAAMPATFALSLYVPATLFALNVGAAATPPAFVSAVAVEEPPVNVPPAPEVGAENVTSTPAPTALPEESRTVD
jgi:hypothetical protein